jgi:hypothetical protein
MAKYYRQQGETKQRKIVRIVRPILLVVFLSALAAVGYFAYDIFRQLGASETPSASTKPATSTIASNVKVQTTQYFQFQTTEKWRAIANETREGHYVYRGFKGQIVDQELIIDINNQLPEVLDNTLITRVLPVTVSSLGSLTVVQEELVHCKELVKPGTEKQQQLVVHSRVTFPCNPDSVSFQVVVGLVGGNEIMTLPRPNDTKATYKIIYRNLSAQQTAGDLVNIISTFETR